MSEDMCIIKDLQTKAHFDLDEICKHLKVSLKQLSEELKYVGCFINGSSIIHNSNKKQNKEEKDPFSKSDNSSMTKYVDETKATVNKKSLNTLENLACQYLVEEKEPFIPNGYIINKFGNIVKKPGPKKRFHSEQSLLKNHEIYSHSNKFVIERLDNKQMKKVPKKMSKHQELQEKMELFGISHIPDGYILNKFGNIVKKPGPKKTVKADESFALQKNSD